MITDLSGNIESVQETLAYGEDVTEPLQTEEGTILNNIGFTGHEHDYGTGFINMQARLQDPRNGKFNVPDMGKDYDVMDPMSWNLYSYVRCNPIGRTDPTGMVSRARKYYNNLTNRQTDEDEENIEESSEEETQGDHSASVDIQFSSLDYMINNAVDSVSDATIEIGTNVADGVEYATSEESLDSATNFFSTSSDRIAQGSVLLLTTPAAVSVPELLAFSTSLQALATTTAGLNVAIHPSQKTFDKFKGEMIKLSISGLIGKSVSVARGLTATGKTVWKSIYSAIISSTWNPFIDEVVEKREQKRKKKKESK